MESLSGQTFVSWAAAAEACHAIAKTHGFSLAIATKRPNATNPSYVFLRCSKGRSFGSGADPNMAAGKRRKSRTQMTACPFRLAIKLDKIRELWSVKVAGDGHNHEMTTLAIIHSKYRTDILQRHLADILRLYNDGLRPALIAAQLRSRDDPDLDGVTTKMIHNLLDRHRREVLAGRSPETG